VQELDIEQEKLL